MNIAQLQKQIELLTDEINDIFHATELNFDAIKIHLQIEDQPKKSNEKPSQVKNIITQCEREFQSLKSAYKERSHLRLEYLINQQIKSEEEKVRRERLLEYEDKIYDHRRLICDKESIYDSLIKPKIKKLPGMTTEQFQEYKMRLAQDQERQNFKQLEEETQILLKLEKFLRSYRISLQQEFDKYQQFVEKQNTGTEKNEVNKEDQDIGEKKQNMQGQTQEKQEDLKPNPTDQKPLTKQQQEIKLRKLMNATPVLYSKFEHLDVIRMTPEAFEESKKLLQQCLSLSANEIELQKEYKEEREMYKYLKWEQTDLIKKYKKLQKEIKELRVVSKSEKKRKPSL